MVESSGDKDGSVLVDYQGNPADNSRTGGWLAAGLILGKDPASEKFAFLRVRGTKLNSLFLNFGLMQEPSFLRGYA